MDDWKEDLTDEPAAPEKTYDVAVESVALLDSSQVLLVYGTARIAVQELMRQLHEDDSMGDGAGYDEQH
jgi:hypothetical protein